MLRERSTAIAEPDKPRWHPIMQAHEYQPGQWVMLDAYERPYGFVEFVRRGDELGYRVRKWAQERSDQAVIGYYRTLRAAASAATAERYSHLTADVRSASGWGPPRGGNDERPRPSS